MRCVEGCCYGKSAVKYKEGHVQIVGDKFWEEISGWKGTATAVMALLGRYAGNGLSEDRRTAYRRMDEYLRGEGAVGGSGGHTLEQAARHSNDVNSRRAWARAAVSPTRQQYAVQKKWAEIAVRQL